MDFDSVKIGNFCKITDFFSIHSLVRDNYVKGR